MVPALAALGGKMNSTPVTDSSGRKTTGLNEFHRDSLMAVLALVSLIIIGITLSVIFKKT